MLGTCFAWLCEIVIVESSWLTTTEYSLASQGSSRVCETVRSSVGGRGGAISSRRLSFDESQKHELSATANRWIFVTPACMFPPLLSLSRILPAVMLSSGISYLLSYNVVGREPRERVSQLAWRGGGCFDSRRRVNSDEGWHVYFFGKLDQ